MKTIILCYWFTEYNSELFKSVSIKLAPFENCSYRLTVIIISPFFKWPYSKDSWVFYIFLFWTWKYNRLALNWHENQFLPIFIWIAVELHCLDLDVALFLKCIEIQTSVWQIGLFLKHLLLAFLLYFLRCIRYFDSVNAIKRKFDFPSVDIKIKKIKRKFKIW